MTKPVGQFPREIDGIVLRKSVEIEEGMQALYEEHTGKLLWVGLIGTNPVGIKASAITLSPKDYELAVRSHLENALREAKRRRTMSRH